MWATIADYYVVGYENRAGRFEFDSLRPGSSTVGESPAAIAGLIESLPTGFLTVDFDPGNFIVKGLSASEALQRLALHVMHVHACAGVRDLARGRGLEVALG